MIHSILVEKLNKHLFLQGLFCFLPALFIIGYIIVYGIDLTNTVNVIMHNDSIVKDGIESGVVKEVVSYDEKENNLFDLTIVGETECEVEIALGSPIYYVYLMDKDWYRLETADGSGYTYSTVCDFIEKTKSTDSGVEYTKNGKTYTIDKGSLLATVMLAKDGSYHIEYSEADIEEEQVNSLTTLEVELATNDGYRFKFHDGYNLTIENIEVNFCSNLPTDNVYYDESSKVFVKNVSADFSVNFVIGSNIVVVILSMAVYCAMLIFIAYRDDLVLLKKPFYVPLLCNLFAVIMLIVCMFVTHSLI